MTSGNTYPSNRGRGVRQGSTASFGSRTDVGRVREQNEDSLIVRPPLFVVADGMGGHAAGEVASEIAVSTIAECAPEHADVEKLGEAVIQANRDIINAALSGRGREGMGTTCTAAILEGNRLVIAQVGDSRAYLLHAGQLTQITRDHSLMANMIEAGQITPEEARVHPSRSVITRALGNDPDMVADLYEINVEDGDRLLLCSDGLNTMVEDDEVQAVMNRIKDPQQCASTLVDGAVAAGGYDNVTVVIADVEGAGRRKRKRLAMKTKVTVVVLVALLVAIIGGAFWGGYTYLHHTAYLAEDEHGNVAVYRGAPGEVFGFSYSELVEDTDIPVSALSQSAAERIREGMRVNSVEEAQSLVESYRTELAGNASSASAGSAGSPGNAGSAGASSAASASGEVAASASASSQSAASDDKDEERDR